MEPMIVSTRRFHATLATMLAILALGLSADESAPRTASPDAATQSLQHVIDALRAAMGISADVRAQIVATDPLLVSVAPASDGRHFDLSFQGSFLTGLSEDELRTIVAHELGHVWIFTHHPYLQTERLANDIALRVVTRDSLARVYDKVWATRGVKGDLARFLPD
jgi:hypothetical protein